MIYNIYNKYDNIITQFWKYYDSVFYSKRELFLYVKLSNYEGTYCNKKTIIDTKRGEIHILKWDTGSWYESLLRTGYNIASFY